MSWDISNDFDFFYHKEYYIGNLNLFWKNVQPLSKDKNRIMENCSIYLYNEINLQEL